MDKLRGDLDEKRTRLERAENEITLLNETNARLRVEADKVTQQAALEKQIEDLKEENKQIRQNTELSDQMHEMKMDYQTKLAELEKEKADLSQVAWLQTQLTEETVMPKQAIDLFREECGSSNSTRDHSLYGFLNQRYCYVGLTGQQNLAHRWKCHFKDGYQMGYRGKPSKKSTYLEELEQERGEG